MNLLRLVLGAAAAILSGLSPGIAAPTYDSKDRLTIYNQTVSENEMSFEKIVDLIQHKNIRSIESLIENLPLEMREENYVIMYRSRSLQAATPSSPRIISFSPSAQFVMTFNGGPETTKNIKGANTVEIIQFRPHEARFEFREIQFSTQEAPQVSEANPNKCKACHQSPSRLNVDMRPNWEPYNIWPGSFGAANSDLGNSRFLKLRKITHPMLEKEIASEKEYLKSFLKNSAQHLRYKHLGKFTLHANAQLTEGLSRWNMHRVVRLMKQQQDLYSLFAPIYVNMDTCAFHSKISKALPANTHFQTKYGNPAAVSFGYLFTAPFELMGINTEDWSLDFGTRGSLGFLDRFSTPSDPTTMLGKALRDQSELARMDQSISCNEFEKESLNKIREYFAQPNVREVVRSVKSQKEIPPTQILQRCSRCHDGSEPGIPYLSFDRPATFRKNSKLMNDIRFRTSDMASTQTQMPPNQPLTPEERASLLKYLSTDF